jgi:glycosyltransferase involved in cell wall biosynthesis
MIITILLQAYNELTSGHLQRFVKWNLELGDHLVALDDQSTDGTFEFLSSEFDLVLRTKCRSFNSELYNKQLLLESAQAQFPETDWFLWLDADELLLMTRSELESLLVYADKLNHDSISLPLVNLWKSENYFRLDSKFDDLVNIRLWKNSDKLWYNPTPGLHQPLHPLGLNNTLPESRFRVLHFGFSSFDLIVQKFASYSKLGQRGRGLWRLVDESLLEVAPISSRFDSLGGRAANYFRDTMLSPAGTQSTIYDYVWAKRALDGNASTPSTKVTLISLIYSGVDWLEFQYGELLKLASELPPGEVEILFVANDASAAVIDFLDGNAIPYVFSPGKIDDAEWYINSVYRSYNYGVANAKGEYVLLTNSDMAYSEGFLYSMIIEADPNKYLVAKLIESGRLKPADSAVKKDLGKRIKNFKRREFTRIVNSSRKRSLENGGLYMPALVHRETFLKYGGYPEGNLRKNSLDNYIDGSAYEIAVQGEELVPGDQAFLQLLSKSSVVHKTNLNSFCYHFQEGEKTEFHPKVGSKIASGIAIANDRLIGINNEKTLWNFLIDDLGLSGLRVSKYELGTGTRWPYRFSSPTLYHKPSARLLFRNATFLRRMKGPWRQIVLVQDAVTNVSLLKNQTFARQNSAAEITNSEVFVNSLDFSPGHNQYLIPLPVDPQWETTSLAIEKKNGSAIRAIFIGAFNNTKGWPEVKLLVEKYADVEFLLVSKYADDDPGLEFKDGVNWKIKRNLSVEQLIKEVDKSDFMILGSPFESQCLVAIECALRNKPIVMKKTGLLSTFPSHDREKLGYFLDDLDEGLSAMLQMIRENPDNFQPREILEKYALDSTSLRKEWISILINELKMSFLPETPLSLVNSLKSKIPNRVKKPIRLVLNLFRSKPVGV